MFQHRQNRPNRFAQRPRFNNRRFKRPGNTIDTSRFIRKASETEAVDFTPTILFNDLAIDPILKENIARHGLSHPTPIQDGAIPHVLEGKDVIGIANTGTGKTAAFLIPLLQKILTNKQTRVLVVAPTRELAQQIRDEIRRLTQRLPVYAALCIGGGSMREQINELRRNPHFVIGTPGRLKDMIDRKFLVMSTFNTFVLDEVDRMLDMGFIRDIKYLISLLPQNRQSLCFSATLSDEIRIIVNTFMKNPVSVSVRLQPTSDNVDQDIVKVPPMGNKIGILEDLLRNAALKKVLIFGRTKHGVDRLSKTLYQKGFKVASIHGNKTQGKRKDAIRMFKENVVPILIATDVAARGIDIADITHVINYDQPATYEDYIHRIGRTGRMNKKGIALTFVE